MDELGVETEEWNCGPNITLSGTPTTPVILVIKVVKLYYLSNIEFSFLLQLKTS